MHAQFDPERLRQKQLDMERMAIADEIEVQDFFKDNADLLEIWFQIYLTLFLQFTNYFTIN